MHVYRESTPVSQQISLPQLDPSSWDVSERLLQESMANHGESGRIGDRFLVGRLIRQIQQHWIKYEFILTMEEEGWTRQIAVYEEETPYDYDFDVFDVRPIEEHWAVVEGEA